MRVLAVVPARGGSVGVPLKNLEKVGGVPLVARAVDACLRAELVDDVVVSTDHDRIAEAATAAGARVVRRPAELSGPAASSETAVLHALSELSGEEPEIVVLVQCTSAFLDPRDLDAAVAKVLDGEADSVFSATETYEFVWTGAGRGVNHDPAVRPRRQDREPHYRETGAFYVMRTGGLREGGHRFFGRVAVQPVPARHAVEIDTPEDLEIARALAPFVDEPLPIDVDAVVTDFDGVHTDDRAFVDSDGREMVAVSRSDGMGIALLRRAGVRVLVLSTERDPVVAARAAKLGVPVVQGLGAKDGALREWLAAEGLDPERVAYVGNDVNDLSCMAIVGWPVAVPDAHPRVRAAARVVLSASGGSGAVRELSDRVLAARPAAALETVPAPVIAPVIAPVTATRHLAQPRPVRIGRSLVGPGQPVYVIGEIGINHNGDVDIARKLIDVAADAGCQAVKFQKRTPEICVPLEQRDQIRQTPWGEMTYMEYKIRTEFGADEYGHIAKYCEERGIDWFASPWDVPSVEFLEDMDVVAHKVASASVTDHELLRALAATRKPVILSTGMSTIEEIDAAVEILGTERLVMMHATSTYPLPPEEANLRMITTLRQRYGVPVGYSGHERGLQISLAAVTLGAVTVERHITLDRAMWGSDHAASLEPTGLEHLVRDIRIIETSLGDGVKRVYPGEEAPRARLRRVTA
ncbi:N-acetylneuraminate synthase family protein [Microbispora sp. H11081]|uniref:N-acetylneuraminate synthase family protein n=1 Tax=Microbispora sp. H11081 TaxID=2729107 RepID=UPI00289AC660|nr:N-acetylneuraminate synthase family protein [Microbispora sp. H11081]